MLPTLTVAGVTDTARLPPVRGLSAVMGAVILLLACGGPDAAHYTAVLEEVRVPEGWTDAATVVHGPGGDVDCQPTPFSECPYVVRFYTTGTTPSDAYRAALSAVAETGFDLEREFNPECDGPSLACALTAIRDADRLSVNVYQPGKDDGTGVARPEQVTVRVTAEDK